MKIKHLLIGVGGIALTALHSTSTFALGDAGQTISNRATVNYQVGSVAQTLIESSPTGNSLAGATNGGNTDFLEDRLLNFTLTRIGASAIPVSPGQEILATASTSPVLSFNLTNTGNGCQDFLLVGAQLATATGVGDVFSAGSIDDDFDTSTFSVLADSTLGAGESFDGSGTDSATFVDELCPTETITLHVVGTGSPAIPLTAINGNHAVFTLTATVAAGNTVAADAEKVTGGTGAAITSDDGTVLDDPAVMQNVIAINLTAAGNAVADLEGSPSTGALQAASAYLILSAELITTKESIVSTAAATQSGTPTIGDDMSVVTDIVLGELDEEALADTITHGTAKRITGAIVSYVIEVQNEDTGTGGEDFDAATASNVVISDDFSAIMGAAPLPFVDDVLTATLITDNGGSETTTTAITTDPAAAVFDPSDFSGTLPVGGIAYFTATNTIYAKCGDLAGNDTPANPAAGSALDEACRLVVDLTVQ